MISAISYAKLKHTLLKNLKNQRICIEIRGIITTTVVLENARIIINKNKIILADDENNFELEFLMVDKIKIDEKWHIQIFFDEFKITLEV